VKQAPKGAFYLGNCIKTVYIKSGSCIMGTIKQEGYTLKIFHVVFILTCGIIGATTGATLAWGLISHILPNSIAICGVLGLVTGATLGFVGIVEELDRRTTECN
jgi:hypothetical protein